MIKEAIIALAKKQDLTYEWGDQPDSDGILPDGTGAEGRNH